METPEIKRKKRALSSAGARQVRQQGHDDALEFALAIGLPNDYQNNPHAKKDVIDPSGDAHSVKSGQKKWQVFLYGLGRFESDDAFRVMNGVGALLAECIKAFPPTFAKYQADKISAKEKLRIHMRALSEKLSEKPRLRAFLNKSLFNGGEVNYLTVKHDGIFHVFLNQDVINVLSENLEVCNSTGRRTGEISEQKVLLRYNGINLGELEMRNDSEIHYREIRFNMIKPKVMEILFGKIPMTKKFNGKVSIYGNAPKRFGRWIQ
ncbi:MAG: hypothetical protein A3J10_01225 [Candidatus Sungbacteria bacterium RIFCSPLOWO2_02_FULL_54_10]|uniref:Uncharacterized protein n=2 Tax=Candidatus Sungiibacteriota TaxID=1817917 RepID=A0A1G2LB68_9BACT|nr:MAG: hypothetical protein A2679_00735 [Candidatus Sungbacteria bacterium RIFCSPHIGHO2_01_FULL_54_26]OHA04202.1 MAG: hypothetical protein A3C92_00405 [Candidatus Sungbacteria bacterium RIFCSPHIGHO2_02_FULL_53_17]OHA08081.1 MAG: hypothetical protein A3B34_01760 [Candidatus Sungbacteria bacterium RIFCSPLOWO2_01_FULL_54_21]OHA13743.1 MAG: hypothetical protein A3J10_01225 [Candidatus Sungbacteria bacterium RIFCSPLOWO2_02_FULL_54_10]